LLAVCARPRFDGTAPSLAGKIYMISTRSPSQEGRCRNLTTASHAANSQNRESERMPSFCSHRDGPPCPPTDHLSTVPDSRSKILQLQTTVRVCCHLHPATALRRSWTQARFMQALPRPGRCGRRSVPPSASPGVPVPCLLLMLRGAKACGAMGCSFAHAFDHIIGKNN
jgi:hypothetical protein